LLSVADVNVADFIRSINRLVVEDTGGWSLATGDQLPGIARSVRRAVEPLAANLDIPARLAPGPREADRRPAIREALTEVVANCAYTLAPEGLLPTPEEDDRLRLASAVSRAYARLATPRLMQRLLPPGGVTELGVFPEPPVTGDVAAVRTVAVGISGRTGLTEDQILTEMAGAGRGGAGPAAARILMRQRPGFTQLPDPEQREVVELVAEELEFQFGAGDRVSRAAFAHVRRREAAERGADAVDLAGEIGDEAVEWRLRQATSTGVEAPVRYDVPLERPESVHELMQRIQATVGELTAAPNSLWNGQIQPLPEHIPSRTAQSPDGTLHLSQGRAALPLRDLTLDGPDGRLTPGQVVAAREAFQAAIATYARWAVPAGHTLENETNAEAAAPRFEAITQAVGQAFAEDNFNQIVERTLPPDLARQVKAPEPPLVDMRLAPAARGLAFAVDTTKGLDANPSETLRQMAGQGRAGVATAAAENLVANSEIPREDRPDAVRAIAETVDRGFEGLPGEVAGWAAGGSHAAVVASRSRMFGQDLGRKAHALARTFENDPLRQQDHALRFVTDPAVAPLRKVQGPAGAPSATRTAAAEQKTPLRDL